MIECSFSLKGKLYNQRDLELLRLRNENFLKLTDEVSDMFDFSKGPSLTEFANTGVVVALSLKMIKGLKRWKSPPVTVSLKWLHLMVLASNNMQVFFDKEDINTYKLEDFETTADLKSKSGLLEGEMQISCNHRIRTHGAEHITQQYTNDGKHDFSQGRHYDQRMFTSIKFIASFLGILRFLGFRMRLF